MNAQAPALLAAALMAGVAAGPALAHPHVWVTARAELVFGPDGKVAGVRHAWTFDRGYSAYVTQGLDANGDGILTPDELSSLARENTQSLVDFGYFTQLKANGAKQAFAEARDERMTFDKGEATLHFLLPLQAPAPAGKAVALEVFDPTYFVAFALAEGEGAVTLAAAPKGCALTVTRPKAIDAAQQQKLSEQFFEALTAASNFGSNFANRAIVACP